MEGGKEVFHTRKGNMTTKSENGVMWPRSRNTGRQQWLEKGIILIKYSLLSIIIFPWSLQREHSPGNTLLSAQRNRFQASASREECTKKICYRGICFLRHPHLLHCQLPTLGSEHTQRQRRPWSTERRGGQLAPRGAKPRDLEHDINRIYCGWNIVNPSQPSSSMFGIYVNPSGSLVSVS